MFYFDGKFTIRMVAVIVLTLVILVEERELIILIINNYNSYSWEYVPKKKSLLNCEHH